MYHLRIIFPFNFGTKYLYYQSQIKGRDRIERNILGLHVHWWNVDVRISGCLCFEYDNRMQFILLDVARWIRFAVWVKLKPFAQQLLILINTHYIFSRSLFAKTARIYLLFSNKSLQIVKYTDRDVGFGVGIVLVAEVVVVATMTALQPPQFTYQNEGDVEFSFCLFHQSTGITLLAFNVSFLKNL